MQRSRTPRVAPRAARLLARARARRRAHAPQRKTARPVAPRQRPPRHRARTSSPTPFEQVTHRGEALVAHHLCRELVEASLRLLGRHDGATPSAACDADWNDRRRGLAVTEDQDGLAAVLGLIHHLREVGLDVCEGALLHVTNMRPFEGARTIGGGTLVGLAGPAWRTIVAKSRMTWKDLRHDVRAASVCG